MKTHSQGWLRWMRVISSAVLVLAATGLAAAEGEPPRLPQVMDSPVTLVIPKAPAAADDILLDRTAVTNTVRYSSQDFVANQDDSQGADDFCIPSNEASWNITNVAVVGTYNNDPTYSVSQVRVFFLTNNGSLPGTMLYAATVSDGNLSGNGPLQGSFAMTLTTPAVLAGNNCYWLSVQAVQPGGFFQGQTWLWNERSFDTTDHSPSAYRQPNNPFSLCQSWGARLATCFPPQPEQPPTNPDLTMRLSGTVGDNYLTPIISTMTPSMALDVDVNMSLTGLNFAPGATISWTVNGGPTMPLTATVLNGSEITVPIPAQYVTPEGGTAIVRVNNPSPCDGVCYSNPMTFTLQNLRYVYVPVVRR